MSVDAVLQLPAIRRYRHFLEQALRTGEVWGLQEDGWALAVDAEGRDVFTLWPAPEYAVLCATRLWEGYAPHPITLAELESVLLPELEAGGLMLGIFNTPDGQGYPVSPSQLREDLQAARARTPQA
ncbi:DUF2750 domain-containing protein [Aggregicoccus sp. 17bor-14]|uniref:DUF2750 domain-containing protein n=1 Tax=Myxococcaceae TaxID=31 RepID=UPI00351AA528